MNRLVLTAEQSAFIRETAIRFAVVHPGSYPENVGRYVVDLIECDYQRAVDACAVATGEARATRPRVKAPETPPEASTAMLGGKDGAENRRDIGEQRPTQKAAPR